MALGQLPEADLEGSEEAIFAEINITPLTDMFLVMLIIFMVSASAELSHQKEKTREVEEQVEKEKRSGLKVNLPAGAAQEIDVRAATLIVAISESGEIAINEMQIADGDIERVFRSAFARDKNTQVVIKADTGVNHGRVVAVMEVAKQVGLTRLAIQTRGN
jgi:biopolymer transport protein ExbD